MATLTAIARATSMVMLSATSLFAQRTAVERPPISPTLLQQVVLAAPANLTLTPAATSASLRWDPVSGATGYLVTRTSAMYGTIQQTPAPITSTSFTDVSQQFDPRYIFTYKVMAVYPDGRYAASQVTYLPAPATVSAPTWSSGGCYGTGPRYTTTWAPVPEATGYVMRYLIRLVSYPNNNGTATGLDIVDTLVTVPASPTSHVVGAPGECPYGHIAGMMLVKSVDAATVSAVFANGAKSAETVCQGGQCSPPLWPYARMTH